MSFKLVGKISSLKPKSILASKWDVCDSSSPKIMSYFYKYLKQGKRKSEALRLAQKDFLEFNADNITQNPIYWSSFFILGDDSPVYYEASSNRTLFIFCLCFLLVLLISVIFSRLRNKIPNKM